MDPVQPGISKPRLFHHPDRGDVGRPDEAIDLIDAQDVTGKIVAVISLPRAITPTCSSTHVPRYNQLAPLFRRYGVDDVVCISVNDAFVMNEWQREQRAFDITFLPDGNGDFSRGMGMLVAKNDLGFGERSWRYSMLVKNGVIEKMFIEPDVPGDPFEVSDADTMLAHIAPAAALPLNVAVFTRQGCQFCVRAKGMLRDAGIEFEELILNRDFSESTLRALSESNRVPQVFIDGERIGGMEDLQVYLANDGRDAA